MGLNEQKMKVLTDKQVKLTKLDEEALRRSQKIALETQRAAKAQR